MRVSNIKLRSTNSINQKNDASGCVHAVILPIGINYNDGMAYAVYWYYLLIRFVDSTNYA